MLRSSSSRAALRQLQIVLSSSGSSSSTQGIVQQLLQLEGASSSSSQAAAHYLRSGGSSSCSVCASRAFSEYAAPGSRGAAGTGLRRVNPSGSSANGSGSAAGDAAAAASTSGSTTLLSEMAEVPGGSKPMRRWEYYYWGLGATGIAFLLYNRLKTPDKTPEEQEETERKIAELRVRRKDHVRSVLVAQNFLLGEDDPLEGLSPAQIVMFCEKYGIDPSDPLEGLTPEEIDAYIAQQAASQEQE